MQIIKNIKEYRQLRQGVFFDLVLFFLCITAVTLPFHKTFSFFPFVLAGICGIIHLLINKNNRIVLKKELVISAAIYIVFIYAYFISSNKQLAAGDLEGKGCLLLAPIIFGTMSGFRIKIIHTLIYVFVFACFLVTVLSFFIAVYKYFVLHENAFYYKVLIEFLKIHPAYLGMYINFAIACMSYYFIKDYEQLNGKQKMFILFIIIWFLIFLLLLSSRTALIGAVIYCNVVFIYAGIKFLGRRKTILISIIINVLGILLLFSLPVTKERFRLMFTYHTTTYTSSSDSRRDIWKSIFNNSSTFWITGTGSGDAIDELVSFYEKSEFKKGVDERYNAHNQILEVWVMAGTFGLLLFILIYMYLIKVAISNKQFLYISFLAIFLLNNLTESMLETQSGTIFFSLFNIFLILAIHEEKQKALQD